MNRRRTPWEIAVELYKPDQVWNGIQKLSGKTLKEIPADVYSREFADWLTEQYRLAMAKGVQLGRDNSMDFSTDWLVQEMKEEEQK